MKNKASNQSTGNDKPPKDTDQARKAGSPRADVTVAKPQTKQQLLADLLVRDSGATLDEMVAATGWLPHTIRAALTGLKKKGYAISSDKADAVRTYCAVAPE